MDGRPGPTGLMTTKRIAIVTVLAVVSGLGLEAAELKPQTIEAFDRYVQLTRARMQTELDGLSPFLWIDRQPEGERDELYRRLRAGEVVIERLKTKDGDDDVDIPKGMVHHWVGTVLMPDVSLDQTMALVQDYDRYSEVYAPQVTESRVIERDGDHFKVFAQLYEKKVLTAVLNTEYDVEFRYLDDTRVYVPSETTRIQEVEHPDTPQEREKPEGNDRGFLWRFNNYCSFEERDGDTLMQCESVSLSRGIPFLLNVFIRPFVTGIPKDKLTFTLSAARNYLTQDPG